MKKIGKISEINRTVEFEWEIHNFFSYSEENSKYFSPEFSVLDSTWQIEIWPNFTTTDYTDKDLSYSSTQHTAPSFGFVAQNLTSSSSQSAQKSSISHYVSLYLCKVNSKSPKRIQLTFSIKTVKCALENQKENTWTFSDQRLGWRQFIERDHLRKKKATFVPLGTLTIVCSVIIKSSEQDFNARPDKLVVDLKGMFNTKKNFDVILKINEDTISAHKDILAARSPVFAAMFENEMEEKKTGIVHIVDCDPEAFNVFLMYIYTGEVEFAKCDFFHLYRIADKYGVPELMAISVDFMVRNLSVDNVCEMFVFGNQFSESNLLVYVQRFFNSNFEKIVRSESWKLLLKDDFNLANDLLKEMAPKIKVIED